MSTPEDPSDLPPEVLVQIESICDEFESALDSGKNPDPEAYVLRVPESARALLWEGLVQLLDEFRERKSETSTRCQASELPSTARFASPASHDANRLPERIGRYEIRGYIGAGAMGVVYRAYHPVLKQEFALKTLLRKSWLNPAETERILDEARNIAKLNHPNIVAIHDADEADGQPFFTMQLVQGGTTLFTRIDDYRFGTPDAKGVGVTTAGWNGRRLRERKQRILTLMEKICGAVNAAHAHNPAIIHRDLKPGNVLLDGDEPKVSDFGLAKAVAGDEVGPASADGYTGTLPYMSPEQHQGKFKEIQAPSDVWALGVTLYELFTGRRPFVVHAPKKSTPWERRRRFKHAVLNDAPPQPRALNKRLDLNLEAVILTCLDKNPANRYQTAGELATDLRRCRRDEAVRVRRETWPEWAKRGGRKHWKTGLVGTLGLLLIVLAALYPVIFPPEPTPVFIEPRPPSWTVKVLTEPPGARLVMVPHDEFGELNPSKAIRPEGRTPLELPEVLPGYYLVVVDVPGHGFHEVYRTVPKPGTGPDVRSSRRWTDYQEGCIQLHRIRIPQAEARPEGMAYFEGRRFVMGANEVPGAGLLLSGIKPAHEQAVASFWLDATEVSIGAYRRAMGSAPVALQAPDDHAVSRVDFYLALDFAEEVGKRLMTEAEYEFAATGGGARRYPWNDRNRSPESAQWKVGRVGEPDFDKTPTDPPVRGLYSNALEWTDSLLTPYAPELHPRNRVGTLNFDRYFALYKNSRVVRGGPLFIMKGLPLDERELVLGARSRFMHERDDTAAVLGFRCARSARARFLD